MPTGRDERNVMPSVTPCYRHPRTTWIAACADCTTWHLAAVLTPDGRALRDRSTAGPIPQARAAAAPTAQTCALA